jgi:hypothetical protein
MEEKPYLFYAFLIGSFVLIAMSMYSTNDLNYIWLLAGDVVTILVWEVANVSNRKGATAGNEGTDASLERKRVLWDTGSWCCIFAMMVLTVVFAHFMPDSHASSVYAILGLMICLFGSYYCEIDITNFSTKNQRSPFTHSFILPFVLWWYCYLVAIPQLIILPAMFCLGAASHLILDTTPTDAGFIKNFESLFNTKYNPKEIRWIPEKWQRWWLLASSLILILCFGFSIPRFIGTTGYIWILPQSYLGVLGTYPYLFIIIIGLVGIAGFIAALIVSWMFNKHQPKPPAETPVASSKAEDSEISETRES